MPTRAAHAHHEPAEIGPKHDAHGKESDGRWATRATRALAEAQHGVVARRQLIEHGLSRELIRHRVESGNLISLHQGVYALGHLRIGRKGRWIAAVLACGPGAVLSHGSAGELWAIRGSTGPPEVTRRSGGTRRQGIRLHQTRVLEPQEMTIEAGIPITSIERTLLDLSARLDARQLEQALVAADRSGRLRWAELQRLLDRTPRRSGVGRLRKVAGEADPRAVEAVSPLEIDFLAMCRRAGLPQPHTNVSVEGFVVDFLWPRERVVVETDGYRYHGDRPAFERDRERTVALAAAGYLVHRATHRMLLNPDLFLRVVRSSLNP